MSETIKKNLNITSNFIAKEGRSSFNPRIKIVLKEWFMAHINQPYPSEEEKEEFAEALNMTKEQGKKMKLILLILY
jgi:hypothetical protein